MKNTPFCLKEGTHYKTKVSFKVQHEIVSGLKYVNLVYRKGIRGQYHFSLIVSNLWLYLLVAKDQQMIGSFGPQVQAHEVTFPRHGWEEAPSGLLSRGSYTAKAQVR